MRLKHQTLILLAGLSWLVIGALLLGLGILFILTALKQPDFISGHFSILSFIERFVLDRANAVIVTITIALMVGYLKGKKVLAQTVARQIKRINSLPNPGPLKYLYSKGYYLLIASMTLLGISLRFWPITLDTRGAIDLCIGSALVNGAVLYFRELSRRAYLAKRENTSV